MLSLLISTVCHAGDERNCEAIGLGKGMEDCAEIAAELYGKAHTPHDAILNNYKMLTLDWLDETGLWDAGMNHCLYMNPDELYLRFEGIRGVNRCSETHVNQDAWSKRIVDQRNKRWTDEHYIRIDCACGESVPKIDKNVSLRQIGDVLVGYTLAESKTRHYFLRK